MDEGFLFVESYKFQYMVAWSFYNGRKENLEM